jgi:hypothetical protein
VPLHILGDHRLNVGYVADRCVSNNEHIAVGTEAQRGSAATPMSLAGRTGSDESPIEYTQRPASLATKGAIGIIAPAAGRLRRLL